MKAPSPAVSGWRDGWYVVPYEVTWRDLDAIGHVNNAVYFTYFEWARTKYWFDMSGTERVQDLGFIVARAECDFRGQLGLSEMIEVCVRVGEMRTSSLDFLYEVKRVNDGEVAATGRVVVVVYDWDSKQKMVITEKLRARIRSFQSGKE